MDVQLTGYWDMKGSQNVLKTYICSYVRS